MIALAGGLGAALAFATATLCSSRASRMLGSSSTVAWAMLIGFLVAGPGAAAEGRPAGLGAAVGWLALAGIGNVVGLLLVYAGFRIGKVGVVAPIASSEGAVAAVIAVVAGERIGMGVGVTLAAIAVGIVLASRGDGEAAAPGQDDRRAAFYALVAAFTFGASLYATGRVSGDLPLLWVVLPARLAGVALVTLPLAVAGRLRLTRRALPLVAVAGLCEVGGFASFTVGARHGIAVAAVLASQFAAIAAVAARILFGERLGRTRIAGVAAIAAGVAVLGALRA